MWKLHPLYDLFVVISVAFQASAKHHYIVFKNAKELQQFLNRKTLPYPPLNAHRGDLMPNFPENAIETFKNATAYKPVIIAFDVALSKDNALVVIHDDKLDRSCTGTGLVANHTFSQLQKFYLKNTQLVANGADILSVDKLKLTGNQLDQYRKTNKMKFHNLIVK